jgi:hypothetical protein
MITTILAYVLWYFMLLTVFVITPLSFIALIVYEYRKNN